MKGAAKYTTNFTPSTDKVIPNANTTLLLNFDNVNIYDQSGSSNLTLYGNTVHSNTQTKNASYSMYFDGTGDYITSLYGDQYAMGTGDFTAEFWAYATTSSQVTFLDTRTADNAGGFLIQTDTTAHLRFWTGGAARIVDSEVFSANTWYHCALVRSSGTTTLYKNGTAIGTYADANNYSTGALFIGVNNPFSSYMTGYIEDLRITKGLARYTANFTPPTSELLG
jgi:hypothetical protein